MKLRISPAIHKDSSNLSRKYTLFIFKQISNQIIKKMKMKIAEHEEEKTKMTEEHNKLLTS